MFTSIFLLPFLMVALLTFIIQIRFSADELNEMGIVLERKDIALPESSMVSCGSLFCSES